MASNGMDEFISPCTGKMMRMLEEVLQYVKESREVVEKQQAKMLTLLQATLDVGEWQAFDDESSMRSATKNFPRQASPKSENEHLDLAKTISDKTSPFEDNAISIDDCETFEAANSFTEKPTVGRRKAVIDSVTNEIIRDLTRRSSGALLTITDIMTPSLVLPMVKHFIVSPRFDFVMSIVIFMNSIYIGIEIERTIHSADESPPILDYVFLFIYIIELSLRCWAFGTRATLKNGWNVFDSVLVAVGSFSLFVIEPIKRYANIGRGGEFLQQVTLLRLLRLLRLVRSLRMLQQFKILWGLVNGLLHALPVILSTLGLLCLLIYIFACGGIELITKNEFTKAAADDDLVLRSIVDQHFGTLPLLSLTLLRFTTMDSIGAIYEPLVRERPVLIVYFTLILLVISITIMNLITAVLVEHSIHMAKTDSEHEYQIKRKRLRQLVPVIEELFKLLDQNGDGLVTLKEAITSDVEFPQELSKLFGSDSLVDLFDTLDADESGSIDKEEFVEGLAAMALSEVPIETAKLLHYGRLQNKEIRTIRGKLESFGVDGIAARALKRTVGLMMCSCLVPELGAKSVDGCGLLSRVPSGGVDIIDGSTVWL